VNYDQPRALRDGGWHYTRRNDDRIHPIGYCADHAPHETEQEARVCYRNYELTERLRFQDDDPDADHLSRCNAPDCKAYTSGSAQIGAWRFWRLCAEHRTRETVEALYGPEAGNSIHS
jgi:hypothetical protein